MHQIRYQYLWMCDHGVGCGPFWYLFLSSISIFKRSRYQYKIFYYIYKSDVLTTRLAMGILWGLNIVKNQVEDNNKNISITDRVIRGSSQYITIIFIDFSHKTLDGGEEFRQLQGYFQGDAKGVSLYII